MKLNAEPHRRFNPLTREWVLVSPHRVLRPWLGEVEKITPETQPQYDPDCYLCPGNTRAGGVRNPAYASTFVFDNDFAALKLDTPRERLDTGGRGLIVAEGEPGVCRVMCFSPRHDLTLATMTQLDIEQVVRNWSDQYTELGAVPAITHVQIFENRGALMGASNPHPHCQIWATASLPDVPGKELAAQTEYSRTHASCLLCDYTNLELEQRARVVCQNDGFLAMVPFWAVWPFEILVCSQRHLSTLPDLTRKEQSDLAEILHRVPSAYDRLFGVPFPYSMGFHQAPTDKIAHREWHLHAHFYPPLLRSASIRKFMVGFEMLGTPQRDITPEAAAERLRSLCKGE